jgi:hypothetical protein
VTKAKRFLGALVVLGFISLGVGYSYRIWYWLTHPYIDIYFMRNVGIALLLAATFLWATLLISRATARLTRVSFNTEALELQRVKLDQAIDTVYRSPIGQAHGVDKKRAIMSMGPQPFYYLDQGQVDDLFPQIVADSPPTAVEVEEQHSRTGGIAARLRFLEPRYERGSQTKTTSKFESSLTPTVRYKQIEKELFDHGNVAFGLEDFTFASIAVQEFRTIAERLHAEFDFDIPNELQEQYIAGSTPRNVVSGLAVSRFGESAT